MQGPKTGSLGPVILHKLACLLMLERLQQLMDTEAGADVDTFLCIWNPLLEDKNEIKIV